LGFCCLIKWINRWRMAQAGAIQLVTSCLRAFKSPPIRAARIKREIVFSPVCNFDIPSVDTDMASTAAVALALMFRLKMAKRTV
jgi:hypothetical protein